MHNEIYFCYSEELKKQVCEANLLLKYGLITFTRGNVSGIGHTHSHRPSAYYGQR